MLQKTRLGFSSVWGCLYWETQAVGGPLRGLDDNVHPEVKPLSLGGMVHYLFFKPLNQLQVLHNRPKVPEGNTHALMYEELTPMLQRDFSSKYHQTHEDTCLSNSE